MIVLIGLVALCSCRTVTEPNRVTDTPIGWWRQLNGGRIAEMRPPPPGVGDPYPTLDQVPARPQPTDAETRRRIAGSLAAQRDQTRRDAANDPLPTLAARAAPAPAPAPTPNPEASTVVVEAASAPPARPAPAPRTATPPPPAPFPDMPAPISRTEPAGELPTLADAPPPRPNIAPVAPVSPTPGAPGPAAPPRRVLPGVVVQFPPSSTEIAPDAARALRTLAGQRNGAKVSVTAAGDGGSTAAARAAALALGLERAQAMAAVLAAAGVPADSMRMDAQAAGRSGSARLIN